MSRSSYRESAALVLEQKAERQIARLEDIEIRKLRDLPQLEDPIAVAQELATILRKTLAEINETIRDLDAAELDADDAKEDRDQAQRQLEAFEKKIKQLQQAHTKETKT